MQFVQIIGAMGEAFGGPPTVAIGLAIGADELGIETVIVTTAYADLTGARVMDGGRSELPAATRLAVGRPSRPFAVYNSWGFYLAAARSVRKSSVVHLHGHYSVHSVAAYVLCRIFHRPYGIQPHGVLEPYDQGKASKGSKRVFDLLLGRRMYKNATYVHFGSESEADRAVINIPHVKRKVCTLGVQRMVNDNKRVDEPLWAALDGLSRYQTTLYLGRLARKKRVDLLILAWAQRRSRGEGETLIIAGPDGDFTGAEIERLAADHGVSTSVRVVGEVSRLLAQRLFDQSSVFVLPTENENFGLTIAEAMLAGCFVITTSHAAAAEHLKHTGGGQVLEGVEPSALAAVMDGVTLSQRRRQDANITYAQTHLSWRATVSCLLGEPNNAGLM